ncbi:hypothetical protein [Mucilaginibacter sp. dw_454]|uniref:hypothetical protein n=1 Tax=Mucilaginibacter sp. dw_454 TaxID=2720079 RepID=UPI001BD5FA0E|nr:hypothetical protein [Mucilaginibacter sp. dw_454]
MEKENNNGLTRRDIVKSGLTLGAAAMMPSLLTRSAFAAPKAKIDNVIGIQIGAISFIDEGVNQVLDNIQAAGPINTLFLATFTYDSGIAGRQIAGYPFPDHGKLEYQDLKGGNYATPHPQFYKNTILKDTKAPDHGDWDMLAAVLPEAKKRGLKTYVFNQDSFTWYKDVPNIAKLQETGIYGQHVESCCDLNPDYINFVSGMTKDICSSYDIDGLMWSSERQGPFNNAIAPFKGDRPSARITCFCQYHRKAAKERGIDVDRALEGYHKLVDFTRSSTLRQRPVDGYFAGFWRIMTDYPEILAYEKLWTDGNHATYRNVYDSAKAVKPNIQAGFHIWHSNSLSPFTKAEMPYERLAYADFIKPVIYNIVGGSRYAGYINSNASTVFGDLSKEEYLKLNNRLMNYEDMDLSTLGAEGMPQDYVAKETKRALDSVQGKCKIYAGLDIDIPNAAKNKQTTPEDAYRSTMTALKAGAQGIIFARKYSEMKLPNIAGGAKAVKDFYEGKG